MKTIILTITLSMCSFMLANAQSHGVMKFAGPSTFGVAAMDAWQDNECDTILFQMNSASDADITIPAMFYKAMNLTIPSFTIHGAQFSMDFATRNAVFAEQTFEETTVVEGEEKQFKGSSFSALYNHAEKVFELQFVVSYGKMPFPVTYSIKAAYISPETGINTLSVDHSSNQPIFNLSGQRINTIPSGKIIIQGGKKILIR